MIVQCCPLTPELIVRLIGAIVLKRQLLRRLGHNVRMTDIENAHEAPLGLHTQRNEQAEVRENLVWT